MKRIREESRESYRKIDTPTREMQVLILLLDGKPRTARECAEALGSHERNYTQPRLTALVDKGLVEVLPDRTWDASTQRVVRVYQISERGARFLEERTCSKTGT